MSMRERTPESHAAAAARAQAAAAARVRDNADDRVVIVSEEERTGAYAGLVTRAIAYSADLVLVNVVALIVGVAVALAVWLLHDLPNALEAAVAAVLAAAYLVWAVGYFVAFWSTTGQTPGARLMRIRVVDAERRESIRPLRAVTRFVGLVLATIPLFAGFVIMLWDDRRRCLQDRLARTVVIHAPPYSGVVRTSVPRSPQ
jgi:uncharacterized RDD family membrane protein YckC